MPQYFDVSHKTRDTHTAKRTANRAGILLHSTEGIDSLDWLQGNNKHQKKVASADYLIARSGNVYQLTKPGYYSYHVGSGVWHHLTNLNGLLNEILIGIELESYVADVPRYTDAQLIYSAALVKRLLLQHMVGILNVEYHKHVAMPVGRRSDPVIFPLYTWTRELLQPSRLDPAFVFPAVMP